MDTITKTKTKNIIFMKIRVCYFFHAVCHSKIHVIPHPFIAAILDVILNILQQWKQQQHPSRILQIQPLMKTIRKK